MDSTASTFRQDLPRDLDAPAQVREALRQLDGIGWVLGDAMIVASELINYVVLCSGVREDVSIEVLIELGNEALAISVVDRIGALAPSAQEDPGDVGMQLVQALARDCGVEREDGCRAWAELVLP